MLDSIIVGGGVAGLSAALILGRARRRVVVCDDGAPRNAAAVAVRGFLSRDGIAPRELLRISAEQLQRYEVEIRTVTVDDARCIDGVFEVALSSGERLQSRSLLLATGVVDQLPAIPGVEDLYGRSVHHCPYCGAWEVRDQPLAAYGRGAVAVKLALALKSWSQDVVLCTDGPGQLRGGDRRQLAELGVAIREQRVARLDGRDGILERIHFVKGEPLSRRALFFNAGHEQHSDLAANFGCVSDQKRSTRATRLDGTGVPGLYVAGDALRHVPLAVVAAADGANVAFAIDDFLRVKDQQLARASRSARDAAA